MDPESMNNPGPSNSDDSPTMESQAKVPKMEKTPTCVIILGMAGSGKSALTTKLVNHLFGTLTPPYVINCDPACLNTEYLCNIDIRDTINYKKVMEKYKLGPNGAIITSLNLFVTNFDQVLTLIDGRRDTHRYVLFDTPGQVEVFTWSASGTIITESLASKFPTVILFVVDSVRSHNPTTFMSNMLYACSVVYKYKLPIIIVMNKSDCIDPSYAVEWMQDSEEFEKAVEQDQSYMACLNQSLITAMDIFYQDLPTVCVSSKTGEGFSNLMAAIDRAAQSYAENYKPAMEKKAKEAQEKKLSTNLEDLNIEENFPEKDECLANTTLKKGPVDAEDELMTIGPKTTNQNE